MGHPTTPRAESLARRNPFEINRRVLASDLSPAAKAILLTILDHARYGISVCTASNHTLAREARVSVRWVKAVMPDLVARRLIWLERATGSIYSRRTIHIEPTIHQVGSEFPLRIHEGGTEFPPRGNCAVHEGGTEFPQRSNEETNEESTPSLLDEEEIDPWTRRWFGPPPVA